MSVSAIPGESRTNEIYELKWTEIHQKASPTLSIVTSERIDNFNNFWCKDFWHYFPSNDCSSSHITECLFLHYLGKPEQAELDKNAIFWWFCFSRECRSRQCVQWKIGQPFDRQLCRKYGCQKLLKSDNPSSSYNRKCSGCFFQTRCSLLQANADTQQIPFDSTKCKNHSKHIRNTD